jgi:hypothetical protein
MTEDELRSTVLDALADIAPEAELDTLPPDKDLRELGHRLDGFPELHDRAARAAPRRHPRGRLPKARHLGRAVGYLTTRCGLHPA